jgi:FAD/FMN-containing dehydrogenase
MQTKHPKNFDELVNCIKQETNILYASAQTSTVIPWARLQELAPTLFADGKVPTIVSLQSLPKKMEMRGEQIFIEGPISWSEADQFARSHGRRMMTMPTEDLASVLAGLATSCTGEHAFGLGTTREQVVSLTYLNLAGKKVTLSSSDPIETALPESYDLNPLKTFQNLYEQKYAKFKNAPFPRMKVATDWLVGSEGKHGPIISAIFKTIASDPVTHVFLPLKSCWVDDFSRHEQIFNWGQAWRGNILAFELIDRLSLSLMKQNGNEIFGLDVNSDYLFFEILDSSLDTVLESLSACLGKMAADLSDDDIFVMDAKRFHALRKGLPRAVAELVQKYNVTKKGTDVQVSPELYGRLIQRYREFHQVGIEGILFGHFGDSHLHYNFFPKNEAELKQCDLLLEEFYQELPSWGPVSPFAEHGIGLLKQKYIKNFKLNF